MLEMQPDRTVRSGLFGPHHAHGLPTTGELVKGDPADPTHLKDVGLIILEVFDRWAVGTPYEKQWKAAVRYLRDPSAYEDIPEVDIADASCHIKPGDHQKLLSLGYWGYTTLDKVKGVVRVFLTPEPWKKRWRMISWTYTANEISQIEKAVLSTLQETRRAVFRGSHAFSIDLAAWYNQLPYEEQVRQFFCVPYRGQWYQLLRAAMGHRPMCFVGDMALQVATAPCQAHSLHYIDNYLGVGSPSVLESDLALIRARAKEGNMTWNEDLSKPEDLIRDEIEFLGLRLNFSSKCVQLVDKVLGKLFASWETHATWSLGQFHRHIAILFYANNAKGVPPAAYSDVLRIWARVQGILARDPKSKEELSSSVVSPTLLRRVWTWTVEVEKNAWVPVDPDHEASDFTVISDASKEGWCVMFISNKSGEWTVYHGRWPPGFDDVVGKSAYAEPLGLLAGCRAFFTSPHVTATLDYFSDNTGNVRATQRGYSMRPDHLVMEHLHYEFPKVRIRRSAHCPGYFIPADEPSRNRPVDFGKVDEFCTRFGVKRPSEIGCTEIRP
jgi:hypothetical protein